RARPAAQRPRPRAPARGAGGLTWRIWRRGACRSGSGARPGSTTPAWGAGAPSPRGGRPDVAHLEARGVSVRFGGKAALNNTSVAVERGSVTGLIGPNRGGKTPLVQGGCGGR